MRIATLSAVALGSIGVLVACGETDGLRIGASPILDEPVTAATAESRYRSTDFDTVMWESSEERLARGAEIWSYACAECHGPGGSGDGGRVVNGDTIQPPSFLQPSWRFAGNRQALRHQIYVGTDRGMPHWGLRRMRVRDIDAVASYILEEMVPASTGASAQR